LRNCAPAEGLRLGRAEVTTLDGNDHTERLDIPLARRRLRRTAGMRIEEASWLGDRATVVGGVTVGRHSVIGPGAVVTRSLPHMAASVGVPARVARKRGA
jgi:acetyltransferase-like isoleucine patch superfamily enzyme